MYTYTLAERAGLGSNQQHASHYSLYRFPREEKKPHKRETPSSVPTAAPPPALRFCSVSPSHANATSPNRNTLTLTNPTPKRNQRRGSGEEPI